MDIRIREYKENDLGQVLDCISELQEVERKITTRKRPGDDVANEYFEFITNRNKERNGKLFVAEVDGRIIGFTNAWVNTNTEVTEYPYKYVYLSDLFVKADYRKKGIAKKLIQKVVDLAKEIGVKRIKVETLAKNLPIQKLLVSIGFDQYEIAWDLDL